MGNSLDLLWLGLALPFIGEPHRWAAPLSVVAYMSTHLWRGGHLSLGPCPREGLVVSVERTKY